MVKSLIKPTVSTNKRFTFFKNDFLIVESREAKSISFESTFDLVSLLNKVDLPELVYPTRAITGTLFFFLLYLWISLIETIFLFFF